jgi:thiaminase (transcriptional activator TenA)
MSWSQNSWKQIDGLYQQILEMPFNKELCDGSLRSDRFVFYISQDSLYLLEFSRALAIIASRAPTAELTLDFIRFAEGAVVVEQALHATFLKKFMVTSRPRATPTCQNYTQYLLVKASLDQVEIAMAAVLPCFWIYKKVGDFIFAHQSKGNNPYQDWINTYSGDEFGKAVEKIIIICDEAAERCSEIQRRAMTEAFRMSSKLEWMFWDSAWRMESWPV